MSVKGSGKKNKDKIWVSIISIVILIIIIGMIVIAVGSTMFDNYGKMISSPFKRFLLCVAGIILAIMIFIVFTFGQDLRNVIDELIHKEYIYPREYRKGTPGDIITRAEGILSREPYAIGITVAILFIGLLVVLYLLWS